MLFNSKLILTLLVIIPTIFAALNGICNGRNGICIKTNSCSNYGGQTFSGKCPSDPNDVKCCDNIPCTANDGRKGSCLFTSQCNGEIFSGKCPGGSDFKCCVNTPKDNSFNGPCYGGGGACTNIDNTPCGTYTVTGKSPETAKEAYYNSRNYINTWDSLVTLPDYTRFLKREAGVDCGVVIDCQKALEINMAIYQLVVDIYKFPKHPMIGVMY